MTSGITGKRDDRKRQDEQRPQPSVARKRSERLRRSLMSLTSGKGALERTRRGPPSVVWFSKGGEEPFFVG